MNPSAQTYEEIASRLNTNLKNGLSVSEAENRLKEYGPNILKEAPTKSPLTILISQFRSFLVIILIVASVFSFFLGENLDAMMILSIVILNGLVGFIQQYRVERAIKHLKKLVTSTVKVVRDGQFIQIPSAQVVPGDLVVIEEGQKIPADIRLSQSYNLQTNEASLTGESTPILKTTDSLENNLPVADQTNMIFSGTTASSGKGAGVVIATGMRTELGKIAHLVSQEVDTKTPLQIKLDHLGGIIGKTILVIAAVIGIQQFIFGQKLIQALLSSVALAVAAIPEGLPAVVTISLALGTRRLLKQQALIRNLPAAETLGSTNVICADKTGTLTKGEMSVRKIYTEGNVILVSEAHPESKKEGFWTSQNDNLKKLFEVSVLASNARPSGETVIGDPTEAALIRKAMETGINIKDLDNKYPRVSEVPFSSDRKMMTTILKDGDGYLVTSKGATEVILSKCSNLSASDREKILNLNDQMAKEALRVLAFASKTAPVIPTLSLSKGRNLKIKSEDPSASPQDDIESNLTFLGLIGMIDPPREEVKEAISVCKKAGIRVVMITGDHLLTAEAIAKEIGIEGQAVSGAQLDQLPDDKFQKMVEELGVYARVNPEHKIKIIKALQAHGHQVAMTGDGVNDAPALKAADIGVAMGISGTDVAKESSDMILLDDNFTTIVSAVKEGRSIYENIRKFVNYLLSSNLMEVLIIAIAALLTWPLPLLPIHLLWINLVTDGLPAIALGVDPGRADIMSSKPAAFREEIINKKFLRTMVIVSTLLTGAILILFGFSKENLLHGQTLVFTAVVLYELIRIVAIRQEHKLGFFSNPYLSLAILISLGLQFIILYLPITIFGTSLQTLFKVEPLTLIEWLILIMVGALLLFTMRLVVKGSN